MLVTRIQRNPDHPFQRWCCLAWRRFAEINFYAFYRVAVSVSDACRMVAPSVVLTTNEYTEVKEAILRYQHRQSKSPVSYHWHHNVHANCHGVGAGFCTAQCNFSLPLISVMAEPPCPRVKLALNLPVAWMSPPHWLTGCRFHQHCCLQPGHPDVISDKIVLGKLRLTCAVSVSAIKFTTNCSPYRQSSML